MRSLVLVLALIAAVACKKESTAPPVRAAVAAEEPAAAPEPHSAGQIAAPVELAATVDARLVDKYLAYRRRVVEHGRAAVEDWRRENGPKRPDDATALSVRAARTTEEFAARMKTLEEAARVEMGLSREETAAVGQVAGEVFAARQIWRMSGGDEAIERARAQLATLPSTQRERAARMLAENERGFTEMKEARSARKRFGHAAVDAVLAQEDALWKVQQDGMRVMSEVY